MKSFLIGLGVGVAAGLLLAPASGEETRHRIAEGAHDLREQGQRKVAKVIRMGRREAGDAGRDAAQKAYDRAVEKVVGPDISQQSRQG
ncbi:MAG TPA: YtxH domain-containing protein [Terriglobales bacterium]|nr:YtxH domain-containing protein [Terriglobales bacterium]